MKVSKELTKQVCLRNEQYHNMYQVKDIQKLISKEIELLDHKRHPVELYEPIKYILSMGGKRLRPTLTVLACNLFTDEINKVIQPAIGLEMFHNFTLMHDDIMDNADIRRNKTTVHKKWDVNTAILSGDAMMILAYDFFLDINKDMLKHVIKVFNTTALNVCEGQQYDMNFEQKKDVTEEQYVEMIRLKTAVLLSASLQIGGIIGGAGEKDQENLYQLGKYSGLAFQLQDDLLDAFGNVKEFGKTIGNDIISNKKTYLLIKALELASAKDKKELLNWINKKNFDPQEKIKIFLNIYERIHLKEITLEKMKEYHDIAMNHLHKINVHQNRKEILENLFKQLIDRKY